MELTINLKNISKFIRVHEEFNATISPLRIGTLKYLEINIEKWPSGAKQGQPGPSRANRGQQGPTGVDQGHQGPTGANRGQMRPNEAKQDQMG